MEGPTGDPKMRTAWEVRDEKAMYIFDCLLQVREVDLMVWFSDVPQNDLADVIKMQQLIEALYQDHYIIEGMLAPGCL